MTASILVVFTLISYLILPGTAFATNQRILDHVNVDLPICLLLNYHLRGRVAFPGSNVYKSQINSYWALNQGELTSSCRVTPWDITDLQKIMYLISTTEASFALKSGGHSVVANTSNIEDGVVVDLALLNHVIVNEKAGYVDVGVGARWGDVYEKLEDRPFGVTGARAGSVGIGGYLLGGGLSVFEGTEGWACDGVVLFEVVLANGTLLEVDQDRHTDLFKGLKGSGGNLGVVSRARLRLIPAQPGIDVNFLQYGLDQLDAMVGAVIRYNLQGAEDPPANVAISIGGSLDGHRTFLGINVVLTHTSSITSSPVLKPFFDIPHITVTQQRMSQYGLALLYDEMNLRGFRQVRTTTTVRNSPDCLASVQEAMYYLLDHLCRLNDTKIQLGLLIQPLTLTHLHASTSTGGNILGLENETSPLLLLSSEVRYSEAEGANTIESGVFNFMAKIERHAAQRKQSHAFRYLNYASAHQDAFGHVRQNKDLWSWLLGVKEAYDPRNVFERQMKHPFKVGVD